MHDADHALQMVGRQDLVDRVIERLVRPDDVREAYQDLDRKFIRPGFYGLAGVGKSRLLQAIAVAARTRTPYVVQLDFGATNRTPPGTPRALVNQIIDELAAADHAALPYWRRLLSRGNDLLKQCQALLAASGTQQIIEIKNSNLTNSPLTQHAGDSKELPAGLGNALAKALASLYVKAKVERSGGIGKPAPRPLVLLLLDTVEAASAPLQEWLPQGLATLWGSNGLHYHVQVVASGRQRIPNFLETELPALTDTESADFLRSYSAARQRADDRYATLSDLAAVRDATPVQERLLELGAGIPLLLGLLTDVAVRTPARLTAADAPFPTSHAERFRYVLDIYLAPLEARADAATNAQESAALSAHLRLIKYAAIPRRLPRGSGLLQALLCDLSGSGYVNATDYDGLRRKLAREAFVEHGEQDSLIYHELMREGLLAAVAGEDRALWLALQQRAAGWFEGQGDEVERLYHALQADYAATIGELRGRIETALAAAQWPDVQRLIELTRTVSLTGEDEAWLTCYKAELAHGEGNHALRTRRLDWLLSVPTLPPALLARLVELLQKWYELKHLAAENTDREIEAAATAIPLPYLRWWAVATGNRPVETHALRGLGEAALSQNRYGEAAGHLQAALVFYRAVEDRRGEANALLGLGEVAKRQARYGEAAGHLQAALALSRAVEDRLGESHALLGLGEAALMQARYGEAKDHFQAALALSRAVEDRRGEARALRGLGETAWIQAWSMEAAGHFQAALALFRAVEDRLGEAQALLGLGEVAGIQNRQGEAAGHYQAALALFRAVEDLLGEAQALLGLGEATLMQARYGEAADHFQAALALSREMRDPPREANALQGLGGVALMQARYGEAADHFQAALAFNVASGTAILNINNTLVSANRALDQADASVQGPGGDATATIDLARTLYLACQRLLPQADAKAMTAYDLDRRMLALAYRLSELGAAPSD